MSGPLKNPRWEKFCQLLASGRATDRLQREAYKSAGYQTTNDNSTDAAASRLMHKYQPILERIAELQVQTARRKAITRDSLVDELAHAQEMADEIKSPAAHVAATGMKAKLTGLLVDKQELGRPGDFEPKDKGELAELYLRHAIPDRDITITEAMRQEAITEMERHTALIESIAAQGDDGYQPMRRGTKRPFGKGAGDTAH
jgi:hypothetical protein